jgi:hypothetical protein
VSFRLSPLLTLESFGRDFERDSGSGGVLKKQVDNCFAAQSRKLLDFAIIYARHLGSDVENFNCLLSIEICGAD